MSRERPNDGEAPQVPTTAPPAGVLAALPRTRPQRASARRAAARAQAQSETAKPKPARASTAAAGDPDKKAEAAKRKPAKRPSAKRQAPTRRAAARASSRVPVKERAPKQGYEPEDELELGTTVHPPSGSELIESIADIFGELASAGASAGGRLLKDAISVLRRP